ncbi:AraC-like DNA-binding protein [Flavobacterium arsenatis]|uniref:AraC-like DNA-binding protein n=1 Tax=Flavobacterium arsenatis TaxID=1484332 RepID=A0ABU1TM85_9FLAO|nr:helix-turn-helix domain-containing protein [Flavobacterium arsenatis]MDR6967080.1 AraC-like DNA-binding protein [Flavobacterium arsenatis]
MEIPFYRPKSEILKKYIDGYYFMSENEILQSNRYWSFPNNYCIATVCQNANVISEDNKISILPSNYKRLASDFYYNNSFPVEIFYEKPRNEVTVYFKPLGINHFLDEIQFEINKDSISDFVPYSDYLTEMEKVLKMENIEEKINAIEHYWLSKLLDRNFELFEQALSELKCGTTISEIAKKMDVSRQHFHKIFFKNIGKSPSDYKKTHRFQSIIENQKIAKYFTDISYNNSFYDQPHFNKDFKKLTGINPSSFFRKVDTKDSNFWLFV